MYTLSKKIITTWIILVSLCAYAAFILPKYINGSHLTIDNRTVTNVSKNIIIHHHLESFYQQKFNEYIGGKRERSILLGRIDIETSNIVFEVEFLNKFKEAIGQSKWYSWQTDKKPGIVFVVRKDQTEKCKQVRDTITNKSDITVFVMDIDGNVLP